MGCRQILCFWVCVIMTVISGSCYHSTVTLAPQNTPVKAKGAFKVIKLNKILSEIPKGEVIGRIYLGLACVDHGELLWLAGEKELDLENYEPIFNDILTEFGYCIVPKESSLFDDNPASEAEILVGAIIKKMEGNICAHIEGGKGEAYVEIEWQVFSARMRKVLLKLNTSGTSLEVDLKGKTSMEPLHVAFGNALRNLLADPKYLDVVNTNGPTVDIEAEQFPVKLVKQVDDSLSKEEVIAQARLSTLTLFAGELNGSGFIISKDGYVLTSQHVVGNARTVTAKTLTGRQIIGEVIRVNGLKDVALIKLESDLYIPLAIGNTAQLQPATDVYAIGSPFLEKFGQSITRGIVSGFRTENDQRYIQSDVLVHPGNSGGPLITTDGYVVGIASKAYFSPSGTAVGVNYFVPIEEALVALNITDITSRP